MKAATKPFLLHEATLSFVVLDRDGRSPLHRQLYREIRRGVLCGLLHPGARIPPTRTLAEELSISRNTVTNAIEQLTAEGFLEARVGDGTYVCSQLPAELYPVAERCRRIEEAADQDAPVPDRARFWEALDSPGLRRCASLNLFRAGAPDLTLFPWKTWEASRAKALRRRGSDILQYNLPEGLEDLRELLVGHLRETRNLQCDPSQVIICAGSQQGLDLTARVMLDRGDLVAREDPGYECVARIWSSYEFEMLPFPVDSEGIVPVDMPPGREPKMIYVTPSCQYPTGVTMSLRRRLELLEYAQRVGAWIIEDDYDGEFRYHGRPVSSLQGLDGGRRVVYIGTFSKTLHPALRIGYMVLPKSLVAAFQKAKAYSDMMSPYLEQAALTEFLAEGHLHKHLRRMTAVYGRRRKALVEALSEHPQHFEFEDYGNGMILAARLCDRCDDIELADRAKMLGYDITPLSRYYVRAQARPGFLLGFTAFPEAQLREGVKKIVKLLES